MYLKSRPIDCLSSSRFISVFKRLHFLGSFCLILSLPSLLYGAPGIELLNQNPAQGDRMGYSVSIDGIYAVVGTRLDDAGGLPNSGSVEIFKRAVNGDWLPHQTLVSPEISAQHHFGHSVGISGDFLVVGEEKNGTNLNGTNRFRGGAAHLFMRNAANDQWEHAFTTPYGAAKDFAGRSVAIDGNYYIVGLLNDDGLGLNAGTSVVTYFSNSGALISQQSMDPSGGAAGDNIGNAVSISGDYAVVGAFRDDDTADGSGSAYVWYRGAGGWTEIAKLVASDPVVNDQFGYSVSIDGDTIAVGSRLADIASGNQVGAAYVFVGIDLDMNGSLESWTQVKKLTASDAQAGDRLGTSVALDGDRLLTGAPQADKDAGNDRSGKAYLFSRDPVTGVWSQESVLVDSETTTRDEFGIGVALDGAQALVGSWLDNRPQNNSGAAYMFQLPYRIGDKGPAGGIVFHVDGTGLGGLEAAPFDQAALVDWCNSSTDLPSLANVGIGDDDPNTGFYNSLQIYFNCGGSAYPSAAASAIEYEWPNGGFGGFLPNKQELNLLWQQKDVVGGFAIDFYWSSSEFDGFKAWDQAFNTAGDQFSSNKNLKGSVRAVRAF